MPNRVPTLQIQSPAANAVVGTQPFSVTGLVTAPGMPEPVGINSVTVQVDAQPAVKAALKHIPNTKLVEVTFSATVQIISGQDPHTITVTVSSDANIPVHQTVQVSVGPRLAVPSMLIDLATVGNIDPTSDSVQSLAAQISRQVASLPLIGQLAAINKIVVGPNLLAVTQPRAVLRIGFWLLDSNFAASDFIPPSATFPLRRFTDAAAQGSFALAPLLNAPPPGEVPPADEPMFGFAFSLSTETLQSILDANFSDIAAQAASHDFTLQSATIRTDNSGSVVTTFSGSLPLGIGMTATLTETLGMAQRAGTAQFMPVVSSSSHSVSVGSAVDWVVGALFPAVGLVLLGAWGLASYGVGQASGQSNGIIDSFLSQLRPRFPFRNSALPADFQATHLFPMAVPNFEAFTTDPSHISGRGTIGLAARDQSMVSVLLGGPTYYPNYTIGVESFYSLALTHFEPDNDSMSWTVTGSPKTGSAAIDSFWQSGGFATGFSLPAKPAPGKYQYTISASATETCATDPSKKLTGSAFLNVTANVVKGGAPLLREARSRSGPRARLAAATRSMPPSRSC
jgi:hypothetical protein